MGAGALGIGWGLHFGADRPDGTPTLVQSKHLQADTASSNPAKIYRPFALNFTTDTAKWTTARFASQIGVDDLKAILVFGLQNSANGTATPTASGFKFQQKNTAGVYADITLENLKTAANLGMELGSIIGSDFNSYVVDIVKTDDVQGILEFRVYQSLSAYTVGADMTYANDTTNLDKLSDYRAIITPPTNHASPAAAGEAAAVSPDPTV